MPANSARRPASGKLRPGWLKIPCIPVLAACVLTAPAAAHELWLERDGDALLLQQGHRSGAHAGEARVPYAAGFVREAACVDEAGARRPLPVAAATPARLPGDCPALVLQASSGYWTKTAWETKNVAKTGIAGVLRSWRADETVTHLARWSPAFAGPPAGGLAVVPLEDPFRLAVGDKLRVRVSVDGRPRAGVPVAYDGATRGASGDDGVVVLRLRRGGLQMISASLETPLADGRADLRIETATLNFELPAR